MMVMKSALGRGSTGEVDGHTEMDSPMTTYLNQPLLAYRLADRHVPVVLRLGVDVRRPSSLGDGLHGRTVIVYVGGCCPSASALPLSLNYFILSRGV